MPPEYSVTRKKCLLRKKNISTCKNVILQIYTVKATIYNITKYFNTTGSHYNFRGIFIFSLSLIVTKACQKFTVFCPFCLAVSLDTFCWFFSLLGWLLTPDFHHYSCLVSLLKLVLPLLVYLTATNSLQMGLPTL